MAVLDPNQLRESATGGDASATPGTPLSQEDFLKRIEKARHGG